MKERELSMTIPRSCSKRMTLLMSAVEKAKEGYTVLICDIGGGKDIVIKPAKNHQTDDKIVGKRLSDAESFDIATQDPPEIRDEIFRKLLQKMEGPE